MAQQTCNSFEPTTNTSSASICKWCGQDHALKVNHMAQQTAVEWLMEQYNLGNGYERHLTESDFEQAKQMERRQILEARQNGLDNGFINGNWDSNLYYNETYLNK